MMRIKLERFPDGDDETHIAYGFDPDGMALVLRHRSKTKPPYTIWVDFDKTKEIGSV